MKKLTVLVLTLGIVMGLGMVAMADELNVNVNIQINASNATNSSTGAKWYLASTPGHNQFSLKYKKPDDSEWILVNNSFSPWTSDLEPSASKSFGLNIFTATTSTKEDPLGFYVYFRSVAS